MLVGEAPGADEDEAGLPFVGLAGQHLMKLMREADLDDYYITNVNKCRPPENRKQTKKEAKICGEFLIRESQAGKPKIIIALGKLAPEFLTGHKVMITLVMGEIRTTK